MVLVVVSKSGSWEPSSAKPRARELSVPSPKVREAADTAIAAWVIESISGNKWSYYQFEMGSGDRQLLRSLRQKKEVSYPTFLTYIYRQTPTLSLKMQCLEIFSATQKKALLTLTFMLRGFNSPRYLP